MDFHERRRKEDKKKKQIGDQGSLRTEGVSSQDRDGKGTKNHKSELNDFKFRFELMREFKNCKSELTKVNDQFRAIEHAKNDIIKWQSPINNEINRAIELERKKNRQGAMFDAPQMLYIGLIGGNPYDLPMPEINQRLSFNPPSQSSSNFFPPTAK